jgi:pimeloyl-ACP methyl ester carboxylesterase
MTDTVIEGKPAMLYTRSGWFGIAALVIASGCAPLSQSRRAEAPQRAASHTDPDRKAAAGECLAALRASLAHDRREAANEALSGFLAATARGALPTSGTFKGPDGVTYDVGTISDSETWPAGLIDHVEPIRPSRRTSPLRWTGWGVPVIGVCKPDRAQEPFAPRQGYRLPVTVVADLKRRSHVSHVKIRLLNPETTESSLIGGKRRPIAGDLQAPNIATFALRNPLRAGIRWLISANRFDYPTNLIFCQPYDPGRIPVVLIHGLLSTPEMWGGVIRSLNADPLIRRNFQFWYFFYPTGQPIPLSAAELRRDLRAAASRYNPRRGIVLVGHSMGGILSRAQVSGSGGSAIFDRVFGSDAPRVARHLPNAPLLRESLFFDHDKNVTRAIFICTPHQGSHMATAGPVGFLTALIRLPDNVVHTLSDIADIVTTHDLRRPPTSICGLSPRSAFLEALNDRPIEVPHHTILGDRERGDSPNSSDGVVRYSSAHLATAESEAIIPAGHGAFRHPEAISEIARILRQDLLREN